MPRRWAVSVLVSSLQQSSRFRSDASPLPCRRFATTSAEVANQLVLLLQDREGRFNCSGRLHLTDTMKFLVARAPASRVRRSSALSNVV